MKALLLTGYNDAMAPIGDLTSPLMAEYAERQGMDFTCIRKYSTDTHPSWQKVQHVRMALLGRYELVVWLDADTVITNPGSAPWRLMYEGLNVSRDWGTDAGPNDFSMGNFVAGADSLPLWSAVERFADEWANKPLWEQSAMRHLYQTSHAAREMIHIYSRRVLNAVPAEILPDGFQVDGESCKVVEPWQAGDWLCHLTMISMEERVRLFRAKCSEGLTLAAA